MIVTASRGEPSRFYRRARSPAQVPVPFPLLRRRQRLDLLRELSAGRVPPCRQLRRGREAGRPASASAHQV